LPLVPVKMDSARVQKTTFGVLFAVAAFLFAWTIYPIWIPIVLGVLLAVAAIPPHRWLEARLPRHPRLLAAAITVTALTVLTGLVCFAGFILLREVIAFFAQGGAREWGGHVIDWLHTRGARKMLAAGGQDPDALIAQLRQAAQSASTHVTGVLGGLFSFTTQGLLALLFTPLTAYYLLAERRVLRDFVFRMVPLPTDETGALLHEFRETAIGIVVGIGLITLYQGVTSGLGFWLFGVPRPLIWAVLTGIVSLLPAVGTGVTVLPIVIWLFIEGHVARGMGLCAWWVIVVVVFADYLLRPWVMGGRMRMHSMLVLLSVFGGIEAFGPMGLALGPLFCALFVALVRIYERDYRPRRLQPTCRIT
jgi:predicted PurR-regulated permease PerM